MTRLEMKITLGTKKLLAVLQNEMLDYFQQERDYMNADLEAYGLSPEDRRDYYTIIRALEYITCMKVTAHDIHHAILELEELELEKRMNEDSDNNKELPF